MFKTKRNAIILAAGTSSRFIPLSAEIPKGLLEVKGEVLIERQIRQLKEVGITDITVVVGYKAEMFNYLAKKYDVALVFNEDFDRFNNISSIMRILDKLKDTYICSSDNYFPNNVFIREPQESFYSALFSSDKTNEYCINFDVNDKITGVSLGGENSWYMIGHVYFSEPFSEEFKKILVSEYENTKIRKCYWEDVYIKFIKELPVMKINKYSNNEIYEFDSIDELREFDESYITDTRSSVIKSIALKMNCGESELCRFEKVSSEDSYLNFKFEKGGIKYLYREANQTITKLSDEVSCNTIGS